DCCDRHHASADLCDLRHSAQNRLQPCGYQLRGTARYRKECSMTYHHTQIAFVIVGVMLAAGIACAAGAIFLRLPAGRWTFASVAAILAFVMVIFSALTVEVRDDKVAWYFGPGLWSYSLTRSEIQSVAVVRNRWEYGLGIRVG